MFGDSLPDGHQTQTYCNNDIIQLSFKEIGLFETLLEIVKKIPLLLTFVSKIILQVVEMASREKMLKIIPMGFVI